MPKLPKVGAQFFYEICLFPNSLPESETGGLCSFGPSLKHDKMTVGVLVNGNLGVLEYTREIPGGWSPVSGWDHVLLLDTWILDHDSDALYSSHSGPTKHSHNHTHITKIYIISSSTTRPTISALLILRGK